MPKLVILQRNTCRNLERNFPHPIGNLSAQLAFRISAFWGFASASALLCVVGWTACLELDSNEVVLPSIDQKDSSPTLWDSFPTSGTENVNLSQQIDFASRGYCTAPASTSLWLFCLSTNAFTRSGILPPASLLCPSFTASISGSLSDNWLLLLRKSIYSWNRTA